MDYCTDLRIQKGKMDFLLKLLQSNPSIEEANENYGTEYGTDEDIFLKRAYFEDGSYVDLSIFTGEESIMSSIYMYSGDEDSYQECDDGFDGDCEFELNGNTYRVSISAIEYELITNDKFSELKNNGIQEYFNVKLNKGSIDVMKNIGSDTWFGLIHYDKGGDLLIPFSNSKNPDLSKQIVCDWYNENFKSL